MAKAVQAVLFDMDGLMLDTETVSKRAWLEAGQAYGYEITQQLLTETIGVNKKSCEELFYRHFSPDFPFATVHAHSRRVMLRIFEEEGITIKPGLLALLDFLEQQGIPKAVGTSTSKESAVRNLTKVRIIDRFDAMACGDEVENGKPAPDIFLLAAKRLGVKPADCLVLEDSENGIRAAYAAGMRGIMVPDLKQPSREVQGLYYKKVDSLLQVIDEIKALS